MIRNLTAAEPSPDPELDALMDSAHPERFRGALPTVERLTDVPRPPSPSACTPAWATSPPAGSAPPRN